MPESDATVPGRALDWIADGQTWPAGRLRPGAPAWASFAQALARNLGDLLRNTRRDLNRLGAEAGLSRDELEAILTGAGTSSTYAIAQIEAVTGHRLWPSREELDAAAPALE